MLYSIHQDNLYDEKYKKKEKEIHLKQKMYFCGKVCCLFIMGVSSLATAYHLIQYLDIPEDYFFQVLHEPL